MIKTLKILIFNALLFISGISLSQNSDSLLYMYNKGEYQEVINMGNKLIISGNENPDLLILIGNSYVMLNKKEKALYYFNESYLKDSSNIYFINTFASANVKNSNYKIAERLYQKVLTKDSLNFIALNNLSKLYISQKKYKDAKEIFRKLAMSDSLNTFYYRKIAYCYYKLKDGMHALLFYNKAYLTDSTNLENISSLAKIMIQASMYEDAEKICNRGIEVDSSNSEFYKLKADIKYAENHYYRAAPFYKKAIQMGDSSYINCQRFGKVLCETQDFENALIYNKAVYIADSSNHQNSFYLCKTYLGLKDFDNCLKYSEKTLKLLKFAKNYTFNICDIMAEAYAEQNNYSEAINMYNRKKEVFNTDHVTDNYKLALLYDKNRNLNNALSYYQKVADYYKKHSTNSNENNILKYCEQRITHILEELHFQGN